MTSAHKLWAIFWVCFAIVSIGIDIHTHEGCVAFCANIANSGP